MFKYLDMKERRPSYVRYRWSHLLASMDDIDPKRINSIPPYVIPKNTGYEYFSFVIVDEETTNHF